MLAARLIRRFARRLAVLGAPLLAVWPLWLATQTLPIADAERRMAPADSERDIIVTDGSGHLILRYAGVGPDGLDAAATDEIAALLRADTVPKNLQADLRYEAERIDDGWAGATSRLLREHIRAEGPGYAAIHVECRSVSCRAHLYEASRLTVLDHQHELSLAQPVIAAFIADHAPEFEPVFLMAGYSQGLETPFIRVILRRSR